MILPMQFWIECLALLFIVIFLLICKEQLSPRPLQEYLNAIEKEDLKIEAGLDKGKELLFIFLSNKYCNVSYNNLCPTSQQEGLCENIDISLIRGRLRRKNILSIYWKDNNFSHWEYNGKKISAAMDLKQQGIASEILTLVKKAAKIIA